MPFLPPKCPKCLPRDFPICRSKNSTSDAETQITVPATDTAFVKLIKFTWRTTRQAESRLDCRQSIQTHSRVEKNIAHSSGPMMGAGMGYCAWLRRRPGVWPAVYACNPSQAKIGGVSNAPVCLTTR